MQAIKRTWSNNYLIHHSIELVYLLVSGFSWATTSPVLWDIMASPTLWHLSMHSLHLSSLILAQPMSFGEGCYSCCILVCAKQFDKAIGYRWKDCTWPFLGSTDGVKGGGGGHALQKGEAWNCFPLQGDGQDIFSQKGMMDMDGSFPSGEDSVRHEKKTLGLWYSLAVKILNQYSTICSSENHRILELKMILEIICLNLSFHSFSLYKYITK